MKLGGLKDIMFNRIETRNTETRLYTDRRCDIHG